MTPYRAPGEKFPQFHSQQPQYLIKTVFLKTVVFPDREGSLPIVLAMQ